MTKVLTFLAILLIAAASVSAQSTPDSKQQRDGAVIVKPVSYKASDKKASKTGVVEVGPRSTYLKEGLSLAAVLQALGKPSSVTERTDNGKTVTTYEFNRGAGRTVIADFVGNVLIHSQTVTDDIRPGVAG